MRQSQLNRVLKLVHRAGDKLIILDQDNDEAFVVMNLDHYENIAELPGDWPGDSEDDFVPQEFLSDNLTDSPVGPDDHFKSNFDDPFDDYVLDDTLEADECSANNSAPDAPEFSPEDEPTVVPIAENSVAADRPIIAEESLNDVPHETEEETFLLEPVE